MAVFDSATMLRAIEEFDKRNYSAAVALLGPLVETGNPRAVCYLAHMYHLGLGVNVDGEKATELYQRVAEQNIQESRLSALACNNLATIYFVGLPGIERDVEKGQQYLARARELGFEM